MADRLRARMTLPVLMKEMRSRMRGIRAQVLIFLVTALAVITGIIIVSLQWDNIADGVNNPQRLADVGKSLFIGLMILEGVLCALIAPALTAGAISVEREQQTLDFLLLTRMSSASIVLGKLFSSLSFVGIILLCALPVAAISFLLGGVAPGQLLGALGVIVATVALFGAAGLYYSSRFEKTATAVAVTYCVCLAVLGLVLVVGGVCSAFLTYSSNPLNLKFTAPCIIFSVVMAAALAVILTATLSVILSSLLRRPMPRKVSITCWLLLCVGLISCALVTDFDIAGQLRNGPAYLLLGNPLFAMATLFVDDLHMPAPAWMMQHFALLSILILFFGAWLFTALAIGQLQQVRSTCLSNSKGKKGTPEVRRPAPEAV
ncbi:MAG: ABC transporter permease [Armatimonadota bacterium]